MNSTDSYNSTLADLARLSRHPPEDPRLRQDLYNAALELLHETESAQDTAQRLYHGVSRCAIATDIQLGSIDKRNSMFHLQWLRPETTLVCSLY